MNNAKRLIIVYLLLITFLIFPSIRSLFRSEFFHTHDFTHVARLVEMDKAIKDGHFPPRLSKNLGWGFGMPLFQFYAPLPYFTAELFHLLGAGFVASIKICAALTFFTAFIGMFFLARKFWGWQGAILAGLAFVYSPYRAVDFYVRGALGELFSISLIPWVLWGISEVIDKKKKKTIALTSFLLASFFLSHTVLNLICFPLFLLFAGFYLLINKKKKGSLKRLVLTFVLSLGLASFFLIPAFFEKRYAQVDKLTSGYSHYSHHFLYFRQFIFGNWGYAGSVDGIEDGMSFHLGKVHLFLALLAIVLSFVRLRKTRKIDKKFLLIVFSSFLILILAFLSTYRAKLIWDAIPLMAFIQFPWRFNSFIIVLIAFLAGAGVFYLRKINKKKISKKLSFIFTIFAMVFLLKINVGYFRPEKYTDPQDDYYTDEKLIKTAMSGVIPDYIPIWVKDQPKPAFEDYQLIEGEAEIEVIESKTQKLSLKVVNKDPVTIQLNRFYFPGWQVFIDGEKTEFEYKENNGIIRVTLPSGNHLLRLVFKNTVIRTVTNSISAASFLIGCFLLFNNKTSKLNKKNNKRLKHSKKLKRKKG